MDSIKANSYSKDNKETKYECKICKDTEWILDAETNTARPCRCRETKFYKKILESSGISEAFLSKTFDNFVVKNKDIAVAKKMAMDYVKNFDDIKKQKNSSIALLGQPGSGKTHLSIAIANELMEKGFGVRYMEYRTDVPRIKQVVNDYTSYAKEINKYKNAKVLMIDDLYKEATYKDARGIEHVTGADLRVMFEIINHRYLKNAPIIVSSEYFTGDILNFDEALGSRILEMCEGHIVELEGKELNYRLYKQAL